MLKGLEKEIEENKNLEKAKILQRFFKTGKGEYGEGDIFYGIIVPIQRRIAKKYLFLNLNEIEKLIGSKIHEKRMIALFILIDKFKKTEDKKEIFEFYLKNKRFINNWDLVDLSSHKIIGEYLVDKDRKILYEFAKSSDLWEKRIAIISTFAFIRKNDLNDSVRISKILLNDEHDLIQKAVGWVLREVGKKNILVLKEFLKENYKKMPRTMLRYSIEKFSKEEREKYLRGFI